MKIEFRDVVKSYGGHRALDGLTLTAPSGAVYGLVGPNGAGKTTAMKHLAGVLRQDSGEVLADGAPVYENPSVKARIFCIPDEIFHFPQASILDMMRFYRGVYPGFDEKRFEQLREVFDLDVKQPMRRFSRGMLKQAAFWLALSMRPELRGRTDEVTARLERLSPIFMDAVPLTLEEIFIYELGGEGHEVRDIIL